MILAHWLASRPDAICQNLTRPSRLDQSQFCTIWSGHSLQEQAFFARTEQNQMPVAGSRIYNLDQFRLPAGCCHNQNASESEPVCLLGGLNQSLHVYREVESEPACLLGGLNQSRLACLLGGLNQSRHVYWEVWIRAGMFTGRFESEPASMFTGRFESEPACLLGRFKSELACLLGGWIRPGMFTGRFESELACLLGGLNLHQLPFLFKSCTLSTVW